MNLLPELISGLGLDHPATYVSIFVAVSLFMVWRLEAMAKSGLEGTALGTLVTPYCSGFGNLAFVYLMIGQRGAGAEVLTNGLVNNVTNLTLLLGLPALFWCLDVVPTRQSGASDSKKKTKSKAGAKQDTERRLSRLSLALTLSAGLFFTGMLWVLGEDGSLNASDGMILVGIFLFWQCFQVVDVLKHNVRQKQSFGLIFYVDLIALLAAALVVYQSLDWLVVWASELPSQSLGGASLGWLSGWLMVLPNAVLAFYYGAKRRADVVYASQVGDGHICIPLCVGLFALVQPVPIPEMFATALLILGAALLLHIAFLALFGRLPRWAGLGLVVAYSWFVYAGLF